MAVLSMAEVPMLRELLRPYGFNVHIHDACGGQSFTLEKTGDHTGNEDPRPVIEAFFEEHRMKVHFYDALNFVAR